MLKNLFKKRIENVIKKYGRGYYHATFLFPREIREATWVYYTFVRLADEIVDAESVSNREQKLTMWANEWRATLHSDTPSQNDSFNEFKKVMQCYAIPASYSFSFLKSMQQDLTVSTYETYADLERYMYGSAVVVGYTMSYIIGFDHDALPYARALGEAFQMTNFLRDICEDYEIRGRVYLPKEDMDRFGVTTQHIAEHRVDSTWQALMKFEIDRTRLLYEKGVSGIHMLHPRGRRAVYAAARMYKEILDMIESNKYDVFSKRAVVSPFRKTVLLCISLWKINP